MGERLFRLQDDREFGRIVASCPDQGACALLAGDGTCVRESIAGLSQDDEAVERGQIESSVYGGSAQGHDAGPFLMTATVLSL